MADYSHVTGGDHGLSDDRRNNTDAYSAFHRSEYCLAVRELEHGKKDAGLREDDLPPDEIDKAYAEVTL